MSWNRICEVVVAYQKELGTFPDDLNSLIKVQEDVIKGSWNPWHAGVFDLA